jgi:hypothetical protein
MSGGASSVSQSIHATFELSPLYSFTRIVSVLLKNLWH